MKIFSKLRNFTFQCRYGFRGIPIRFGPEILRLDESLRRWSPDLEKVVREAMENLVRPGDIVFDIGANFGLHALYLARRVSPQGRVYAFEPAPCNLKILRRNIALNDLSQIITVVPKAVSDLPDATLNFYIPDEPVAVTAGLHQFSEAATEITVSNIRLDDFEFQNRERLRLLKIDVEGAELGVLKGAIELLRNLRPFLLIEVHGFALPSFGFTVFELRSFLEDLGYKEHRLAWAEARGDDYYQALFEPLNL